MKDLGSMNFENANRQCSSYIFCGNIKGILPNKTQLFTLYKTKSQVNSLLSANDGTPLTNDYYWSSSLDTYYYTYYILDMSDGTEKTPYSAYNNTYYVRPIFISY